MKNISIKVYRPTGEFIKDWSSVANFEEFIKEINAGLGECIVNLGVPFDYDGSELDLNNIVEIDIADKDTKTNGFTRIYSGYISLIEPFVDGKKEGITVHLLGEYTKLSLDYLKNENIVILYSDSTNGITTTSSGTSADIGLIVRGILNRYRLETTSPKINYSITSIPDIGQNALYSFRLVTYREAIDKIINIFPAGYFWYVDEYNIFTIKQKSSTPIHTFEFGKHFKSLRIQKSMETLRNFVLVWDGDSFFKNYSNSSSILKYGRRVNAIQDNAIGDSVTANGIASKYLNENKDQEISIVCEIIDNNLSEYGYDIESIQPGDTCKFIGFNSATTDILNENMLITKVIYNLDKVILSVKLTKTGIIDNQKKLKTYVEDLSNLNVPATYS